MQEDAQIGVVQSPTEMIGLPLGGMIEMANRYPRTEAGGESEGQNEVGENDGATNDRQDESDYIESEESQESMKRTLTLLRGP